MMLAPVAPAHEDQPCTYELVVLGAGQDAGAPQIGNAEDAGPVLLPSSIAVIDHAGGRRYLFDASPAITQQLTALDHIAQPQSGLGIDGVFLTHAHMGHYLGLAWLGREAAGASDIPVYAMPRMAQFLRDNGPWSQLVTLGNIDLQPLEHLQPMILEGGLTITPFAVPHRDEYSETVGFVIAHPDIGSAAYLPDIDYWHERGGENFLLFILPRVDRVFIDATFWDDDELSGRDMSQIPHPRITDTMDLLADLPAAQRNKVHFIHYNHTNPVRDPASAQSAEVVQRGFHVARRGDRHCLASR